MENRTIQQIVHARFRVQRLQILEINTIQSIQETGHSPPKKGKDWRIRSAPRNPDMDPAITLGFHGSWRMIVESSAVKSGVEKFIEAAAESGRTDRLQQWHPCMRSAEMGTMPTFCPIKGYLIQVNRCFFQECAHSKELRP
jgi:hypothetical protein